MDEQRKKQNIAIMFMIFSYALIFVIIPPILITWSFLFDTAKDVLSYPPAFYPFFIFFFAVVYLIAIEISLLWKKFPRNFFNAFTFLAFAIFNVLVIFSAQGFEYALLALKIEGGITMIGFFIYLLFRTLRLQKKIDADKLLSISERRTLKHILERSKEAIMLIMLVIGFLIIIPMIFGTLIMEAENMSVYDNQNETLVISYIIVAIFITAYNHIKIIK